MPESPKFYLGRIYDPASGKTLDQPLFYDPDELTTHAIVTGMTGSGKTGLCIAILEEAALRKIPAIIVDPKGDLTNLLLHFPDLLPQDFEPWIDPESPRRLGKDLATLAAETAALWQKSLAEWGLGREQLLALQKDAQFTIYTPGSSAGQPVNILSSFSTPGIPWGENSEILREKIASIITALLGLIGLKDVDPLRSREHILLSNLLENAWSHQQSFDLVQMILQTQNPPFDRLGAFPLDQFFPAKDRMDLALLLNNFLASPSFQSWLEGQPLDISSLLFTADGRPRHNIFYLAHLSEDERMFFVTLLFACVEAWMRSQRGTGGLRTLIYFDELMGYLPAVGNPPSRPILLRMLKQARAFGVGLLLASQNPVDVDYKALSNAGTWFIGRLQTEQDKQRLMDGLTSAGGNLDTGVYNQLISGLSQRVFLLHSVHLPQPQLLSTRWTLNYLAGPMTRAQIPALNRLAASVDQPVVTSPVIPGSTQPAAAQPTPVQPNAAPSAQYVIPAVPQKVVQPTVSTSAQYSSTRPSVPTGLPDFFLPLELGVVEALKMQDVTLPGSVPHESILYHPALMAQAQVRYLSQRYQFGHSRSVSVLVAQLEGSLVKWEDFPWKVCHVKTLDQNPLPGASFVPLPGWLSDTRRLDVLKKDFVDWVYRTGTINLRTNAALKVYAGPQVSETDFQALCSEAARKEMEAEIARVSASYNTKLTSLRQKVTRLESVVGAQKQELEQRRVEEVGAGGELLLSMITKRRRSVTIPLSKHRLAEQAKADLDRETQELEQLKKQLTGLEQEQQEAVKAVQERWSETAKNTSEIPLVPNKKDIYLELFGVAWMPYYLFDAAEGAREVPAFQP